MRKVSLERYYFVLYDGALTLNMSKMALNPFCNKTIVIIINIRPFKCGIRSQQTMKLGWDNHYVNNAAPPCPLIARGGGGGVTSIGGRTMMLEKKILVKRVSKSGVGAERGKGVKNPKNGRKRYPNRYTEKTPGQISPGHLFSV